MVAQNVFHRASSHQIEDFERFAGRCNIPWNMPTIFHLDPIATIQQRYLPSLCALLFKQHQKSPICVVWTCNVIPGEIFTSFAEFQRIVSVNDFCFPLGFQELLQASLGFLWSFCFCTDTPGSIEWLDPAPRLHIDDCVEIRNCRLGPCDLLLSNHQNFLHEARLRHCVFCTGIL